jgi:hypothetical protein
LLNKIEYPSSPRGRNQKPTTHVEWWYPPTYYSSKVPIFSIWIDSFEYFEWKYFMDQQHIALPVIVHHGATWCTKKYKLFLSVCRHAKQNNTLSTWSLSTTANRKL